MVFSNVLQDIFLNKDTLATVIVLVIAAMVVAIPLFAATTALERRRYRLWMSSQQKVRDKKIATILLVNEDGVPTSFLLPKYSELPRDIHFEADPRDPKLYRIISISLQNNPLSADA